MRVFVTVGSTKFDALVEAVLSQPLLDALASKGYTDVVVQCGNSRVNGLGDSDERTFESGQSTVCLWRFKSSLDKDVDSADIVISHAGSGTILDVLRKGKPLVVVPNETLLDNHQRELAEVLGDLGHLRASSVADLLHTIVTFTPADLKPFPAFDGSRFRNLLDREMGYVD